MPTNSYDLIVLGDDLPGVVAATLCAARGMRVLLAGTDATPRSYKIGPHTLPVRPMAFVGQSSPAVKRVMEELGFAHLLKRRLVDNDPAFQFIAPGARIDVSGDDVALGAELERYVDAEQAAALLSGGQLAREVSELIEPILGQAIAFPPNKFFDRREIARNEQVVGEAASLAQARTESAPLARALACAPAALSVSSDPRALSAVACARAFDLWRRGVAQLPGGREALRAIFLDKFSSHGGEVRAVVIEELSVSWGKVNGVLLRDREELGADHVISTLPIAELAELLGKKAPKRLAQLARDFRPAGYRYTLNLVLAEPGIPEGIGATSLVVNDIEAPLIGDNAVAVHVGEPDDEARVTVSLEAICEAPEDDDSLDDAFADLRIRLRERLEQIMPFSLDHILVAHSPHESADPEGSAAGKLELAQPVPPEPVWHADVDTFLGVAAAPYSVGLKRLTVASPQVIPGLGLEGDFEIGWCAALIACSGAKKRDFLKDEVIANRR